MTLLHQRWDATDANPGASVWRARAQASKYPNKLGGSAPRRRERPPPRAIGSPRLVTARTRLDVANVASWLRSQAPK